MKKYLRYILPVCLAGSLCTSCTDFFETDSDGVLKTEGQRYQDETTARAGLFGLLQGLQRIGDNYVRDGELFPGTARHQPFRGGCGKFLSERAGVLFTHQQLQLLHPSFGHDHIPTGG